MERFLTPEEILRIKQEEALRAEIRKELTPPEPLTDDKWQQKIWKLLNSTFGIWFLSSVVVAVAVHFYNENEASRRERETQRKEQEAESRRTRDVYGRITIEIAYRLSSTMTRLKAVSEKFGQRLDAESQHAISKAFDPLRKPAGEENPPLFPEYKSYSGVALIAELRRHAGEAERQTLTEILAKTSGFIEETVRDKIRPERPASHVALELRRRMSYSRWDIGFPYVACPDTNPFC